VRMVEAAEAEVELRREERRTHICIPVRLVRKMRCRFGCSVGPCFLVPKILYAMQNGFGSPDACFVGDSLNPKKKGLTSVYQRKKKCGHLTLEAGGAQQHGRKLGRVC